MKCSVAAVLYLFRFGLVKFENRFSNNILFIFFFIYYYFYLHNNNDSSLLFFYLYYKFPKELAIASIQSMLSLREFFKIFTGACNSKNTVQAVSFM